MTSRNREASVEIFCLLHKLYRCQKQLDLPGVLLLFQDLDLPKTCNNAMFFLITFFIVETSNLDNDSRNFTEKYRSYSISQYLIQKNLLAQEEIL